MVHSWRDVVTILSLQRSFTPEIDAFLARIPVADTRRHERAHPICRRGLQKPSSRTLVLLVEVGLSAARVLLKKRHQNTQRSRATAPADLEPPKGLGLGLGLWLCLGSGWSGPTLKVEIGHTVSCRKVIATLRLQIGRASRGVHLLFWRLFSPCPTPKNELLTELKVQPDGLLQR